MSEKLIGKIRLLLLLHTLLTGFDACINLWDRSVFPRITFSLYLISSGGRKGGQGTMAHPFSKVKI